ncbi:cyclopropane-fatty-acyl-phospholipid synthase family protein [Patulibacter sp.]|uniref:SAM-dependent methyltransferase n=1 Tax=Patulibacter sp. TaxID=1912859 RepID=UPI002720F6B3|nr:class I SAM-dependent methyltransferase [Patulibacter sp.]MDO9409591.1 class I SAM-dependent methyltransferase [Patulibacter sp.]
MTTPPRAHHDHHPDPADDPRAFWESHYERQRDRFRGNPNALALDHLEDLGPGSALELGSGQGADAIWLARRGWTVLATELSATVLRLADERAREAGVADRIEWRRHDLASGVPDGSFDLVLSSYTQSPVAFPRTAVLRAAADRVAAGGTLLIVGHSGTPSWTTERDHAVDMPDAATLIADLDLPEAGWTVDRSADVERPITDPEGRPATRQDSVVRFRRRPV